MKKLTFILTVLSALSLKAEAKKLYIRAGVGYASPAAGQTRDVDGYPINGTATIDGTGSQQSLQMRLKKASFGSGVNANLAVGYSINEHIAVELNGLVGIVPTKYEATITEIYPNVPEKTTKYTQYAKLPIFLIPAIKLQTGKELQFYIRAGVVLPLKTNMESEAFAGYYSSGLSSYFSYKTRVHSQFNLGISAATGVSFNLSKHFRIFAEANMMSLSLYIKDVSSGPSTFKYKMNANSKYSESGTYSYPFSTVGGSIGLQYSL